MLQRCLLAGLFGVGFLLHAGQSPKIEGQVRFASLPPASHGGLGTPLTKGAVGTPRPTLKQQPGVFQRVPQALAISIRCAEQPTMRRSSRWGPPSISARPPPVA